MQKSNIYLQKIISTCGSCKDKKWKISAWNTAPDGTERGMTGTKMINATFNSHRKTKASKIYKQFFFIVCEAYLEVLMLFFRFLDNFDFSGVVVASKIPIKYYDN